MAFITQQGQPQYKDVKVEPAASELAHAEDKGELEKLVFGVTQTSQSTLLLKKRKEMREVDEALEFMKEEYKARMEACDERQHEFEIKQKEMKEQVARFEKFVQENDAKRSRAEQKAKLEAKLRVQQEEKLSALRNKLEKMQGEREGLEENLRKLQAYQSYLDSAVEATEGEYEEIPDILNRYKTLKGANADLKKLVEEGDTDMDQLRAELNQLRRETQNALLVHNSAIHANQQTLENIRATGIKAENERELGEKFTKDRHRESGQVVMSIKNLYNRSISTSLSKQSRGVHNKNKPQLQLLSDYLRFIQYRITDLQNMASRCRAGAFETSEGKE